MPLNLQTPVGSPFGRRSTARDVLAGMNLSSRTVLVTGGYSGLGLETVAALVEAGAHVIAPARNQDKARAALGRFGAAVTLAHLDLADLDSIASLAEGLLKRGAPLDLLINNAGIMACPEQRTSQGWEFQFATNHLGHYALAVRLLPLLRKAEAARVIALSSLGHLITPVDFDDPMFERRPYEKWTAYGQSKTANALFAVGFASHFASEGILSFSVHPGGIMTDLQRDLAVEEMRAMGWIDDAGKVDDRFKTPAEGAATTCWAATSALLAQRSGAYCEDCEIAIEQTGRTQSGVRAHAVDAEAAERLWEMSERLTGVSA